MKYILASTSPRRREIIKLLRDDFTVTVTDADETLPEKITPQDAALFTARKKALAAESVTSDDRVILAADTVVADGERIIGKPVSPDDAVKTLLSLGGKSHLVITGVCIVAVKDGHRLERSFFESTRVEFYPISREDAENYVATGEPLDKAGSYGIQGRGALFVKGIEGDYLNVVGLPAARLSRELRDLQKKL